jgi:transcriptional regulatory protein RtcR
VNGTRITFNKEARERFLRFATGPDALWSGNFRDLDAAVVRMATFAPGGRITVALVEEEIERLRASWSATEPVRDADRELERLLGAERFRQLDRFDRIQLADVVAACRAASSLSDAGRGLYAASRLQKKSANDADRLRKYLARFGLDWNEVKQAAPAR